MEAWIKFRAPGVTLAIGLSIGRLVFFTLNKIEWIFAVVLVLHLILYHQGFSRLSWGIIMTLSLILILQTFWLLPELDARAQLYMDGQTVQKSNLHFIYILGELLKVLLLSTLIILQFKISRAHI